MMGPQLVSNNIMSLWAALLLVVNHIWQAGPMFPMVFLQTNQSGHSVCRHMWQSQMLPSLSLYYLMVFHCSAGSSTEYETSNKQWKCDHWWDTSEGFPEYMDYFLTCHPEDKVAKANNKSLTFDSWWGLFIFHVFDDEMIIHQWCKKDVLFVFFCFVTAINKYNNISGCLETFCPSYFMFEKKNKNWIKFPLSGERGRGVSAWGGAEQRWWHAGI